MPSSQGRILSLQARSRGNSASTSTDSSGPSAIPSCQRFRCLENRWGAIPDPGRRQPLRASRIARVAARRRKTPRRTVNVQERFGSSRRRSTAISDEAVQRPDVTCRVGSFDTSMLHCRSPGRHLAAPSWTAVIAQLTRVHRERPLNSACVAGSQASGFARRTSGASNGWPLQCTYRPQLSWLSGNQPSPTPNAGSCPGAPSRPNGTTTTW